MFRDRGAARKMGQAKERVQSERSLGSRGLPPEVFSGTRLCDCWKGPFRERKLFIYVVMRDKGLYLGAKNR